MSWNQSDATTLRNYLAGHPNFIEELKSHTPEAEGETIEKAALTGQRKEGYEQALKQIETLCQDQHKDPTEGRFVDAGVSQPNKKTE
jgi:hypothetical protein